MIDGFFDLVSNMSLANELKWFLLLYFIRQIFVYFVVFFSFVKCKSHTHRYMKWDKITHVYSTSSRFFICYCFVELQVLFLIFGFVVVVIISFVRFTLLIIRRSILASIFFCYCPCSLDFIRNVCVWRQKVHFCTEYDVTLLNYLYFASESFYRLLCSCF